VVIRAPGRRFLGPPQPARPEAAIDLDFALLSQSAYGDIKKDKADKEERCVDAKKILENEGWCLWRDFPGTDLQKQMDSVHLRAEVWTNRSKSAVVVAFGGTVFSNWKDWKSNLRWFYPFRRDEYTLIVSDFGPEFARTFARKKEQAPWEFLKSSSIYSTGHSLGGGLAQEFAYSLPIDEFAVPRVIQVYAFDPSPVTAFSSVKRRTRNENKNGLKIDRIYERGEVLAILRSITNAIYKPPSANPEVRQVRYNLFGNDKFGLTDFIAGHSIQHLACKIREAAVGP
jgi:hypothetical protein